MTIPFQLSYDHQRIVPANIHAAYVVAHIDSLRPTGYTVSFGPALTEVRRWVEHESWVCMANVQWNADANRAYVIYNFPAGHGWLPGHQYQIMIPPFFVEIEYPDGHTERFQHSEIKLFGWVT